jgi:hypothetical protein
MTLTDLNWFSVLIMYKQAAVSALIVKNNRKVPQPGVDIDRTAQVIPTRLGQARDLLAGG